MTTASALFLSSSSDKVHVIPNGCTLDIKCTATIKATLTANTKYTGPLITDMFYGINIEIFKCEIIFHLLEP